MRWVRGLSPQESDIHTSSDNDASPYSRSAYLQARIFVNSIFEIGVALYRCLDQ